MTQMTNGNEKHKKQDVREPGGRHNMPHPLWPLTFWPWKWCKSHVWRGLPLCQF